jgi:hypothetical protein
MMITEPVILRKLSSAKYQAAGRVEGYGPIVRLGRTEKEAKDRFFEACNTIERPRKRVRSRQRSARANWARPRGRTARSPQ